MILILLVSTAIGCFVGGLTVGFGFGEDEAIGAGLGAGFLAVGFVAHLVFGSFSRQFRWRLLLALFAVSGGTFVTGSLVRMHPDAVGVLGVCAGLSTLALLGSLVFSQIEGSGPASRLP